MQKGKVSVNTENIFPIIKKFLYTDHEIFLRELVSNAVDACQKASLLARSGQLEDELGDLKISIKLDEEAKTLTISDNGIGMTEEEIDKYINQIAFSGAEEFVDKFKDAKDDAQIIGHFGLGFYSSFMVADTVEIDTLSHRADVKPAHWKCEGTTDFKITRGKRKKRGTDVILHLNEEGQDFNSKFKIKELLDKYCKYLPIPIEFDGETINNTSPIWKKAPADLTDEDYTQFYSELYPMAEPPLFWIHLNVDYPFNLTGILYFPKYNPNIDPKRNKIRLYSNQVYVTDNVEDIVPEYLMLLHGVIDSPDIPLNVSRSSLQADAQVKKITGHISKKVTDKLNELFKADRKDFEMKWESVSIFAKYGMMSDEKFNDRAKSFLLLQNVDDEFSTLEEYQEKIKANQTDKDDQLVVLYSTDKEEQHHFIRNAKNKGYDVLNLSEIIDVHFVGHLERTLEKSKFKRVDSESIDQLIDKGEEPVSLLSEDEEKQLVDWLKNTMEDEKYEFKTVALSDNDEPLTIVKPEFERRMKEMQAFGGGPNLFGNMPEKVQVMVNTNHSLIKRLADSPEESRDAAKQAMDLALLAQNMLKGEDLSEFINRNFEKI
jgi:molecular chaperone HtpG